MARIIVNSFFRSALGAKGGAMPADGRLELDASSIRNLLTILEAEYPGSKQALASAAVAIDGDIYTDALTEPLCEDSELVFIPAIEGG